MRYVSVFSGVEAATVAWEQLGWEPVAFCEVDAFPSAVLAQRFPDVPNLGDITKVDWEEFKRDFGTVDLVVGWSPCQSFSIAGKREGLSGASGLMWEYVRCVQSLRPRWFVWENVKGALSSENGEAFRCLLASMDELGYQCCWRVLDAQFFNVAQRRERVFLVGSLGDGRAAEVLFEPDCLRWDTPSSRDKRKALAAGASGGADGSGGRDGMTPCIGMSYKAGAKAQAFHASEELHSTLSATRHDASVCYAIKGDVARGARMDVHAVPYTMKIRCGCEGGGKGALIQEDVSATLSCSNVQTLFQPTYCIQGTVANGKRMGQNGSGFSDDGVAYTVDTMDTHAVVHPVPVVIDRAAYNQGVNAQYPPHIELVDVMDTLVARGPHAVAYQAVDC